MEIENNNDNNKKMREEGPTRNYKWGILKYLSAEISSEKSEIIPARMTRVSDVLGQKLGYDNWCIVCIIKESCCEFVENHTNKILDVWSKLITQSISTWVAIINTSKIESSERKKENTRNLFIQFGLILT